MKTQINNRPTLPTFGALVPNEGGRLGGIMRGALINGVYQPDYALIVPDLPAAELPWGKYGHEVPGAKSLTDGLANTQDMLKANCEAAQHIHELAKTSGHADLYLAARAEYWALRANVPELFDKAFHWTSTQISSGCAFVQDFENGYSVWLSKDYTCRVRPVRRIPLQHFPT